jgi:Mg2+ and Co2+ transporter CorA
MDIIIYSVVSCFFQETEKLENKQDSLIQEIEKLRQEKEQLEELVKIHSSVCPTMKIKCSH